MKTFIKVFLLTIILMSTCQAFEVNDHVVINTGPDKGMIVTVVKTYEFSGTVYVWVESELSGKQYLGIFKETDLELFKGKDYAEN